MAHTHARLDSVQRATGGICHGFGGFQIDGGELIFGKSGVNVAFGDGRIGKPLGNQNLIGGGSGRLGVQLGKRDTANAAIADILGQHLAHLVT